MTLLQKPIRRELVPMIDRRTWTVELHAWGVTLRQKHSRGEKGRFDITWESIFERAAQIKVAKERLEKLSRRKGAA